MNLLKLTGMGHASNYDPNKIENLAAAGLGYHAHVGNNPAAGQEVIDRAQKLESDIHATGGFEFPHVVQVQIPHALSSVSHTWSIVEKKTQALDHIVIPLIDAVLPL